MPGPVFFVMETGLSDHICRDQLDVEGGLAASDLDQLAKFVTDKIQGIDGVQRTIT